MHEHEHENTPAGDGEERPKESERRPLPESQAEQDAIFAALVAQFDDPVDLTRPDWPEIENIRARTDVASQENQHSGPQPRQRVQPPGPRDWAAAEDPDEDHFVPPEPPPLPTGDTTSRLAWTGVLGGPALLLFDVFYWHEMAGWPVWVGLPAFLAGFVTLIARLKDRDPDDPAPPNGGAVV